MSFFPFFADTAGAIRNPLPEETVRRILEEHRSQTAGHTALKMDRKRNISRVRTADGRSWIVKEFKKLPFWAGERHLRRCMTGTACLESFTPQCRARIQDSVSGSSILVFGDCGEGNFYEKDYQSLSELEALYGACGELLARLHQRGIYHQDTKPANFVRNQFSRDECPGPACLIDCDNVRKFSHALCWRLRIHNLAQFVAGTGKLATADRPLWLRAVRAFQEGYLRLAGIPLPAQKLFWQAFWEFLRKKRHVECNLDFLCTDEDLKKLRQDLH